MSGWCEHSPLQKSPTIVWGRVLGLTRTFAACFVSNGNACHVFLHRLIYLHDISSVKCSVSFCKRSVFRYSVFAEQVRCVPIGHLPFPPENRRGVASVFHRSYRNSMRVAPQKCILKLCKGWKVSERRHLYNFYGRTLDCPVSVIWQAAFYFLSY